MKYYVGNLFFDGDNLSHASAYKKAKSRYEKAKDDLKVAQNLVDMRTDTIIYLKKALEEARRNGDQEEVERLENLYENEKLNNLATKRYALPEHKKEYRAAKEAYNAEGKKVFTPIVKAASAITTNTFSGPAMGVASITNRKRKRK